MNTAFDTEVRLKLLQLLKEKPQLTQREMNQKMGISLGKVNYCISALVQKGMIKVERFSKAPNKSAYIYRLTPKGFEELTNLLMSFLKFKVTEFDRIKSEIKLLLDEVDKINPDFKNDPDLLEDLKNIN
jgi:EPS-associated MarR family transcriptional regulator